MIIMHKNFLESGLLKMFHGYGDIRVMNYSEELYKKCTTRDFLVI